MTDTTHQTVDRRQFFKSAGAGVAAAGLVFTSDTGTGAAPQQWTEKDKLARIASCSVPHPIDLQDAPDRSRD